MSSKALVELVGLDETNRYWLVCLLCATRHFSVREVFEMLSQSGTPFRVTEYRIRCWRDIIDASMTPEQKLEAAASVIAQLPVFKLPGL